MVDLTNCPVCTSPYVAQCHCPLSDRVCQSGHEWHRCLSCKGVATGPSNHSVDTDHPDNWCDACKAKGS